MTSSSTFGQARRSLAGGGGGDSPRSVTVQLSSAQDASFQLAKGADGSIRVVEGLPEARWPKSPTDGPRASDPSFATSYTTTPRGGGGDRGVDHTAKVGDHMARVALRQAEERTRLLVECAGLVKRMEVLDQETARYPEWLRYPRSEDWYRGSAALAGASPDATAAYLSTLQGEEAGAFATYLSHATRSAEFEASVWRHRAGQLSHMAGERDKEAARRLLKFDFAAALRETLDERAWLRQKLQEQDAAMDRMKEEVRVARGTSDSSRLAMDYVQRRADEQRVKCEEQSATCDELAKAVASKEKELLAMRSELRDFKSENEVKLRSFSAALAEAEAAAKHELERASADHEVTRRELRQGRVDWEIMRQRLEAECGQLRSDQQRAQDESTAAYKELSLIRGDLKRTLDDHDSAQKGRAESEVTCQGLRGNLSTLRGELQRWQQDAESMSKELQDLRLGSARLRTELVKSQEEMEALRKELADSRLDGAQLRVEVQKSKEETEAVNRELTDSRLEASQVHGELRKSNEELETVRKEYMDGRVENAHLRGELQKSKEETESALKDFADSRADANFLRGERARLQEESESKSLELSEMRLEQTRLSGELQRVQEEAATANKELTESRISNMHLRKDNEATLRELHETQVEKDSRQRALEAKERECERLSGVVASRDSELGMVRRDLGKAVVDGEAFQAEARSIGETLSSRDSELAKASQELSRAQIDCQAHLAHIARLEDSIKAAEADRETLRYEMQRGTADLDAYKTQVAKQEREILAFKAERDSKEQVTGSAIRRAELLSARCENLEAALSSSHSKQADIAVELEAHKERSAALQRALLTSPSGSRTGLMLTRGDSMMEPVLHSTAGTSSRTGSTSPRVRSSTATSRFGWVPGVPSLTTAATTAGSQSQQSVLPPVNRPMSARSGTASLTLQDPSWKT